MPTLTIDLPAQENQTAFNLRRWSQLRSDSDLMRELERFPDRFETDRHGHLVMFLPAGFPHGSYEYRIGRLLDDHLPDGRVATECPISTADGVKVSDVVWISRARISMIGNGECLTKAPEICVEVISPSNTRLEMAEKRALYFAAGAREVWLCARDGRMTFYTGPNPRGQKCSKLCPEFPREIRF